MAEESQHYHGRAGRNGGRGERREEKVGKGIRSYEEEEKVGREEEGGEKEEERGRRKEEKVRRIKRRGWGRIGGGGGRRGKNSVDVLLG